ncbi:hypothetical protein Tco_0222768, partial [Tanacetum coccineum]
GLKRRRKLKHGALKLYVGNGMRAVVQAIWKELKNQVNKKEVENQLGKKIKAIRSDREGEYLSHQFVDHMKAVSPFRDMLFCCSHTQHGSNQEGYEALVKQDTPDKLKPISVKCIFVGYPKETMGYYFYNPHENKIFVARYAEFFENSLTLQEANGSIT